MTAREIERFRGLLLEERARLKEALERRSKAIRKDVGGESGENVYSDHMADMALLETEGMRHAIHSAREWKLLKEVEHALLRIDKKTYGICMQCGRPIAKERLRLVPYARYCAKCESKAKA